MSLLCSVKYWIALWRRRNECKDADHHLGRCFIDRQGRWDYETEHTDWDNLVCDHCGRRFFQYVDPSGNLAGPEINR